MHRKFAISVFLILITSQLFAARSLIQGEAMDYKGKFIRLFVYEDYLTYKEKEIAKAKVGLDGKFEVWFEVEETQYAFLRIDNEIGDLFVEPGVNYRIAFPPHLQEDEAINQLSERNFHRLKFLAETESELNQSIQQFNEAYDQFLEENYKLLMRRGVGDKKAIQDKIEAFKQRALQDFGSNSHAYFINHIEYSVAQVKQTTMVSEEKLYSEFLEDKPFLEKHYEYMRFFHQFYEKKVEMISFSQRGHHLAEVINDRKALNTVEKLLAKDPVMENEIYRQAALIKEARRLYYNKEFKKPQVVNLLEELQDKAATPYLQLAASNMKEELTRLSPGSPAPSFKIRDVHNNFRELNDFAGKYIYLEFTDINCPGCIAETAIIQNFAQKYGDKIAFVTITVNNDWEEVQKFVEKHNYDWTFLVSGMNHKVLEDFEIKAVPEYVLIDRQGNILQAPADRPSRRIEEKLQRLK